VNQVFLELGGLEFYLIQTSEGIFPACRDAKKGYTAVLGFTPTLNFYLIESTFPMRSKRHYEMLYRAEANKRTIVSVFRQNGGILNEVE